MILWILKATSVLCSSLKAIDVIEILQVDYNYHGNRLETVLLGFFNGT